MKKRLLITSIVMMLVVAVALSTATYAWFTQNASVSASSITLTANTNGADALGIGWGLSTADGASAGTEIVSPLTATLDPMAPATLTVGTTLSDVVFKTSTIKTVSNTAIFNANGTVANPVFYNDGENEPVSTFFVKNLSTANSVGEVRVTASIEPVYTETTAVELAVAGYTYYNSSKEALETQPTVGEAVGTAGFKAKVGVDLVRVAIFKKDGANGYKLVGVMAKNADAATIYGTITANSAAVPSTAALGEINGTTYTASTMSNFSATAGSVGLTLGGLSALASHDLIAIAWLDGAALGDSQQGQQAIISLTFAAEAA
jgi:hypothetical protein